jgi:hypothetical protein
MPLLRGAQCVALANVRIIGGTGEPPGANQMLLIEGARILAVGNPNKFTIPERPGSSISVVAVSCQGLVCCMNTQAKQPLIAALLSSRFGVTTSASAMGDRHTAGRKFHHLVARRHIEDRRRSRSRHRGWIESPRGAVRRTRFTSEIRVVLRKASAFQRSRRKLLETHSLDWR